MEMNIQRKGAVNLEYLVRRARQGDGDAFIELIERNRQDLYKVARSYFSGEADIADAIQDTIEAAYCSIGHLKEEKYFRTWLIRILINKCIDIRRKKQKESPTELFPDQGEMCAELMNCEFEDLMRMLDEKYRTILLLYYGEGLEGLRDRAAAGDGREHCEIKIIKRQREIQTDLDGAEYGCTVRKESVR